MRYRIVGRILAAQALSSVGTSMSTIALAVMVYRLTGSVLQMGGILAASTLPLVLTLWVGGAILDRYSARTIMVISDLARAALVACMPFLARENVGLVYLIAALLGIFSGVFNPGQIKFVGEVVEQRHLVRANSYLGVARDGAELVGYLLGALVANYTGWLLGTYQLTGYTLAFVVDAASYLLSAVLLLGLPRLAVAAAGSQPPPVAPGAPVAQPVAPPKLRTLVAESPGVFAKLWANPALRTNLLLAVFAMGAVMMSVPNSYILAQGVFKLGSLGLGAMEVFVAVGLIAGGLFMSTARLSGDKNAYVLYALVAMGVCYIAVGYSSMFWVSIALMGAAGAASAGVVVPSITMFQEAPAGPEKGRLLAIRSSFGQLAIAAGFAVGGLLGQRMGIKHAFVMTGGAAIIVGLVIYVPYRLSTGRRLQMARDAALLAGVKRSEARRLAADAVYSGLVTAGGGLSGPGTAFVAWDAAEAAESSRVAEEGRKAQAVAGLDLFGGLDIEWTEPARPMETETTRKARAALALDLAATATRGTATPGSAARDPGTVDDAGSTLPAGRGQRHRTERPTIYAADLDAQPTATPARDLDLDGSAAGLLDLETRSDS